MTRLVLVLVFISILGIRLVTGQPEKMVVGTRVRLTIPTVDYPEHADSYTVVKRGEWEVRVKGYTDFMPGDVVEIEGVVDERGRVIESKVESIKYQELEGVDWGLVQIAKLRHWAVGRLQQSLPEPQASLAIGILLGAKRGMPREFYDQLVNTGTLHIIAASGYNVAVVAGLALMVLGGFMPRYLAMGTSMIAIVIYVLLAGAGPAIVRAGVMGSLTLIGVILGRVNDARWLLWVTAWVMLMVKPELIVDIGFQLSMSATIGLLYLGSALSNIAIRVPHIRIREIFDNYFVPTLAATVATAPVLFWQFGRVSLIGVLVNLLILPVVPLIMLLSAISVVITPTSYLLYVPLWWMVWVIRLFGG